MRRPRPCARRAPDTRRPPLAQFDARIAADGVKLSKREYETCKHLLSGKTVPETAEILGVRVASAESYVKRAFAKLGVRTKRELAAWGSATTTPLPPARTTAPHRRASRADTPGRTGGRVRLRRVDAVAPLHRSPSM